MKHKTILWLFILSAFLLSACDGDSAPASAADNSPGQIAANNVEARQNLAAAQTQVALTNKEAARATANAQATDRARAAAVQATEQAFNLQQKQAAATATVQAVQLQATLAAQNVQATAAARSAAATASASEAKATADARAIAANLDKAAATATQQAIQITIAKAEAERARSESDAEFYNAVWRIGIVVLLVAAFIFGCYAVNQMLNVSLLRRSIIETRNGTVMIVAMGGQPSAHFIGAPTPAALMPAGDDLENFEASQARTIDAEAESEPYKVVTNRGVFFIPRVPDETHAERQLVLRLLRESAKLNGWQSSVIATAKALQWSDDTRARAVDLIRDYIITKEGRGGGTFVGNRHKTLLQLYSDVGSRRITLHSPKAEVTQSAKLSAR